MDRQVEKFDATVLTREQAKSEERFFWSRKTVAERLSAAAAITKDLYRMRGIDLDAPGPPLTAHFVARRQG
jgi:hypothetical protein